MARWEGNTRGRLERAALDLFTQQGYDGTTVAQIAHRANLTERSFYRWFTDKRDVLFAADDLERCLLPAIDAVPAGVGALTSLLTAFEKLPQVLRPREFLIERTEVIAASPPLQERELIKMASLSDALAEALLSRGHDEQAARLAVDAGLAVLRVATDRWVLDEHADFAALLSTGLSDLIVVVTESSPHTPH